MSDELLTILFTDVEGSTALHAAKGDAEARRILGACDEVVRQQVREHGGREIKSTGDGFMIAFGSPRKAVACALAIQDATSRRGDPVRVRAGIHIGEVSEEAGDLFGGAVNAAARICAKAQGGEVLVSEVVRQLCGTSGEVDFRERGLIRLRGFPEKWRLYQVAPHVLGTPVGERTPFVGRAAERAQLRALMERAIAGQGGLVMIGAEPGVGKTRLSEEIATEAQGRCRVFVGHCYERERDLPYMPWVEMIERLAGTTSPEMLRQALGDEAPEFGRLVPQLRRLLPDMPPPLELPPDQQRRYTFNCLREYVTRASRAEPRLYVLEDLHWADESTLLLLEHLAERLPTIPCMVIGTYRDAPVDISPRLAEALSALVRRRQARVMNLKCHSHAEVAAMLRVLSGQSPPEGVVEAVYGESEGNAFFVEEVFRHLVETGKLLDDAGRFRAGVRVNGLDVPANVRLVIGQRLDRLGEPTRRVLTVAAVIGRRFGFQLLEGVSEVGEEVLLDALDEAERAHLIASVSSGMEEHYWFAHELIRQTLLARLSGARRRRTHLRVADTVERLYGGEVELHTADIAHHLVQAGEAADRAKTAHFLALTGDRALDAAAFEEALRHYQHALSLLSTEDTGRRGDLLLKMGKAQRSLCRWDDAMAACDQALTTLEGLGDVQAVARVCWEFGVQLAWAYRSAEAVRVAERGLALVGERSVPDRARMLALSAIGLGQAGSFEKASTRIQEAKRLAVEHGDERLLGDVGFTEVLQGYYSVRLDDCLEAGRRTVERLRAGGSLWNLADTLPFVNAALVFRGRFDESDAVEAELEPLAARLGDSAATALALRWHFLKVAAQTGDLAALTRVSDTLSRVAHDTGNPGWLSHATTVRGIIHFWRGNWVEAHKEMVEATRLAVPGQWFGIHHGFLSLLLAFQGRNSEAFVVLDEATGAFPVRGTANMLGPWSLAILASEAVGLIGDVGRARELYPLIVEALATSMLIRQYDGGLIQKAAGMVAATSGLHDEAEEHFETALRQAEELPHLMERPQVRHFYGRFLMERGGSGDRDRARALLEEAVAGYHAIGMPRHEAMARELLGIDAGRVHG